MLRKIKYSIIKFIKIQVKITVFTFKLILYTLLGILTGLIVGSIVFLTISAILALIYYLLFQKYFDGEEFLKTAASILAFSIALGSVSGFLYGIYKLIGDGDD